MGLFCQFPTHPSISSSSFSTLFASCLWWAERERERERASESSRDEEGEATTPWKNGLHSNNPTTTTSREGGHTFQKSAELMKWPPPWASLLDPSIHLPTCSSNQLTTRRKREREQFPSPYYLIHFPESFIFRIFSSFGFHLLSLWDFILDKLNWTREIMGLGPLEGNSSAEVGINDFWKWFGD